MWYNRTIMVLPFVNLGKLRHSRVTNLAQGKCNNVDFVLLFLGHHADSHANIHTALSKFRGVPLNSGGQVGKCSYLTDRTYGYVSFAKDPSVPWPTSFYRFGTNRTSLWYRLFSGVYALNTNGLARLQRVLATL